MIIAKKPIGFYKKKARDGRRVTHPIFSSTGRQPEMEIRRYRIAPRKGFESRVLKDGEGKTSEEPSKAYLFGVRTNGLFEERAKREEDIRELRERAGSWDPIASAHAKGELARKYPEEYKILFPTEPLEVIAPAPTVVPRKEGEGVLETVRGAAAMVRREKERREAAKERKEKKATERAEEELRRMERKERSAELLAKEKERKEKKAEEQRKKKWEARAVIPKEKKKEAE